MSEAISGEVAVIPSDQYMPSIGWWAVGKFPVEQPER